MGIGPNNPPCVGGFGARAPPAPVPNKPPPGWVVVGGYGWPKRDPTVGCEVVAAVAPKRPPPGAGAPVADAGAPNSTLGPGAPVAGVVYPNVADALLAIPPALLG